MRNDPVDEAVVRLSLNGSECGCFACTPEHLDALAAGWLLASGAISSAADLEAVEVESTHVRARAAARAPVHGCDPLESLECLPPPQPERERVPGLDAFPELFRALYAQAPRSQESGGMHVAGLATVDAVVLAREDVGRHNAVDKAIGAGLLRQLPLHRHGLVLSARISGEIALKAARAGLAWVASRSVPTTLALQVAARARLPLIARAGGAHARVFLPDDPPR